MVNTIFHKSVEDFLSFNSVFLDENYFLVHPLLNIVDQHRNKVLKIESAFSIVDDGKLAIGIQCHPFLLLYSIDWNDTIFAEILRIIPFEKMRNNVLFSGTHGLIEQAMTATNKQFKVISHRNVYECTQVADGVGLAPGEIARAQERDVKKISELSWAFQNIEFGDRDPHDLEYMRYHIVLPGIENGSIVKWTDESQIVSIAQVIIGDRNKPEIGLFFTDPKHQSKGYGCSLIWKVTNAILKDFEVCGLITNPHNVASNRVFKKVGYVQKYTWIKVMVQ